MRITPLDVRKQEFRRSVRGLDPDEVHAFLATVADEYEAVLTDNKQLREKVIELDEKVSEYRNMERTLRDTLITAERVMTEARQNARKESELILRDAELKAQEQTANIAARVEALRTQVRELRGHRDSYLARLQSLSEAQIGLLESYRRDFQNEDRSSTNLVGSGSAAAPVAEEPASSPASDVLPETPEPAPAPEPFPAQDVETAPAPEVVAPAAAMPPQGNPEDHWRSYSVGAESQSASVAPTPPTPAPPVETRIEALDQTEGAAPQTVMPPSPETPSYEPPSYETPSYETPSHEPPAYPPPANDPAAPAAAVETTSEIDAPAPIPHIDVYGDVPASEGPDLAFQFTDTQPPAPAQDAPDPVEEVTRAYQEMESEPPGFDAPAPDSDWTPVGGHPESGVAPYDAVPGPEGEADPEAAEEGAGSRWSLSRFTRGLGNF